MKLTKTTIKEFETEQKEYGSEVALYNLLFTVATDLLHDLGIESIKVTKEEK